MKCPPVFPYTLGRTTRRPRYGGRLAILVIWSLWLTGAAHFVPAVRASETKPHANAWQLVHHTRKEELPQDCIKAIAQTRDGCLWLGTSGGLVRFDGTDFTVFDAATTPTLAGNRILSILAASNGDLWIGTERSGVTRYRDGEFRSYRRSKNAPVGKVQSIVEDRLGVIWFGAERLVRYADEKFESVAVAPVTSRIWSLHVDRDGDLWVASNHGLSHLHDGRFHAILATDSRLKLSVRFIGEDSQGTLWASGTDWLATVRDGQLISATETGDLRPPLSALLIDRFGSDWFAGRSGLYSRSEAANTWSRLAPKGLFGNISAALFANVNGATSLIEDREGSIWVGTLRNGLFQFRRSMFTAIQLPTDGRPRFGVCLPGDAAGEFWIVLDGGIAHFVNNAWEDIPLPSDAGAVRAITGGRDGAMWIACDRKRLLKFNDVSLERYDHSFGRIHRMLEGRDGVLWIVSKDGLSTFEKGRFKSVWQRGPLPELVFPVTMYESSDGTVWVGANRTITSYRDGKSIQYGHADGLPNAEVRSMLETADGSFWISTYGAGLVRLRNGEFTKITKSDGLPGNALGKILDDDHGNLWVNSNRGVFHVSLDELNAFSDGRTSKITAHLLETGEGNGYAGGRTFDGRLWFPTAQNLVIIDPSRTGKSTIPPVATIKSVIADGAVMQHDVPLQIQPNTSSIDIHFSAASFIDPEGVRFRYMLDGYDEDWVEAGTRRMAHYTKLPLGEYRFRVAACNAAGIWSESEASLRVRRLPHIYETIGFQIGCGLSLLGIALGGHRIRTRSIRRRNAELRAEISDRERAETKLCETEQWLRQMTENSNQVIGLTDRNTQKLLYVSPAYEEIYGRSCKSLYEDQSSWIEVIHPEDRARVDEAFARKSEGGEQINEEYRIIRQDGGVRWMRHRRIPVHNETGEVYRWVGIAEDITDRRQAQVAAGARAKQQTAIAKLGQQALACKDVDVLMDATVEAVANALSVEFCKVLELRPGGDALLLRAGVGWADGLVGHATVDAGLDSQAGYTLISNDPVVVEDLRSETRFTGPPLLLDHGVVSGISVVISGGDTPFGVLGAHTVEKRIFTANEINFLQAVANVLATAVEHRRAQVELSESEARFRDLFESANDAIISLDANGNILVINQRGAQMTGYTKQELTGANVLEDLLHPDDRYKARELFINLARGKNVISELRWVAKDGSVIDCEVSSSAHCSPEGQIVWTRCIVRDVTERKRTEEALRHSERLASIGTLAAGIAHEINNPLGSIYLSAEHALNSNGGPRSPQITKDCLSEILVDVGRCASIVKSVLRFARQESSEKSFVDLNEIIRTSVDLTREYADQQGARIELVLGEDIPPILANELEIEQVLVNLIRNAVEAGKDGALVTVRTHLTDDGIQLAVCDTGAGVTKEQRRHMFDPFFTTRKEKGGTGLGLSLVHGIIADHGGELAVDPSSEQGTTLIVSFPLRSSEAVPCYAKNSDC